MSGLKIGLVASGSDESSQLATLLEKSGAQLAYQIEPENISEHHIEDKDIHVWLLSVDDDSWHDSIDQLLDESEIPVYFSEPGNLAKQSHPEFWCNNLLTRLYEITGLEREPDAEDLAEATPVPEKQTNDSAIEVEDTAPQFSVERQSDLASDSELNMPLGKSLKDLELSAIDLPKDIAADLVSELESISPVLREESE